jgi:hypothetical protein
VPTQIRSSLPRLFVATVGTLVACLTIGLAFFPRASIAANPAVPVTPFLDCVRFNGDQANPIYTAYFGYNNTGPVQFTFAIGDDNAVAPGSIDAGQPTTFNVGNFPRLFGVEFDGVFVKQVSWELNGVTVTGSSSSPTCTTGVTAAASGVATDSATLNGVVTPEGHDVTYTFEYGTSTAFGQSTPTVDAGSGTQPKLEQVALTGLAPSTQYFFRLDTTSDLFGTDYGQQQSFTTPPSSQVASPLTLTTTAGLPHATFGSPYAASLAASGGAPPYTWKLTDGSLPSGLSLAAGSGVISGTPTATGTSHLTAQVSDAGAPSPQTATEALSITVERAATSTHLTASANAIRALDPVTYAATVSRRTKGSGAPTGQVTFTDNGRPIRCSGVSKTLNSAGVATCTTSYNMRGRRSISATYAGDANFLGSQSRTLSETVRPGHQSPTLRSPGRAHRRRRS